MVGRKEQSQIEDKHLLINLSSDFLSPFSIATGSVCSGETDAHSEGEREIIPFNNKRISHEIRESSGHQLHQDRREVYGH